MRHTRPREVDLRAGGARSMSGETHQPAEDTFRTPGWKGQEEEPSCLIRPPISLSLPAFLCLSLFGHLCEAFLGRLESRQ